MAREERRARNDERFAALEQDLEWVKAGQASLKRKVDEVTKCQTYVLEGGNRVEELYCRKVGEGAEQKLWRELKEEWADALLADLAQHVAVNWPLVAEPLPRDTAAKALAELYGALKDTNVIRNVHPQMKWNGATQQNERVPGSFVFKTSHELEALEAARAVKKLDPFLRRASGLKVRGKSTLPENAPQPKRVLLYLEKTQAERERAQGWWAAGAEARAAAGAGAAGAAGAEPAEAEGDAAGKGAKGKGKKGKTGGKGKKGKGHAKGKMAKGKGKKGQ
jgi:hypothetical protein